MALCKKIKLEKHPRWSEWYSIEDSGFHLLRFLRFYVRIKQHIFSYLDEYDRGELEEMIDKDKINPLAQHCEICKSRTSKYKLNNCARCNKDICDACRKSVFIDFTNKKSRQSDDNLFLRLFLVKGITEIFCTKCVPDQKTHNELRNIPLIQFSDENIYSKIRAKYVKQEAKIQKQNILFFERLNKKSR